MRVPVNDIPTDWMSLQLGRQFVEVLLLVLAMHLFRRWLLQCSHHHRSLLLVSLMTTCLSPQRLLERLTRLFRLLLLRVQLRLARYVTTRVMNARIRLFHGGSIVNAATT